MLTAPTFDIKLASLAKMYRMMEMYEHQYMRILAKELAKRAAQQAAEKAAKEAADIAAQQAEIDAANALAFGPPPGLVSESHGDAEEGSHRSAGSSRSDFSESQGESRYLYLSFYYIMHNITLKFIR